MYIKSTIIWGSNKHSENAEMHICVTLETMITPIKTTFHFGDSVDVFLFTPLCSFCCFLRFFCYYEWLQCEGTRRNRTSSLSVFLLPSFFACYFIGLLENRSLMHLAQKEKKSKMGALFALIVPAHVFRECGMIGLDWEKCVAATCNLSLWNTEINLPFRSFSSEGRTNMQ